MTKIVIDGLGADRGPDMVASACKAALEKRKFDLVVVGPEEAFKKELQDFGDRVEYINCEDLLENTESPARAIRQHKSSSLVQAFRRLNEEDCQVMLSAGSSGALLAGGYFITGRIPHVDRCPFMVSLPNARKGTALFLDAGATMDSSPKMLVQYAYMADTYARYALKRTDPKVGLLNVGSEEGKGDKRTLEAYKLLQGSDLNFAGNLEGQDLLATDCDIILADGFTGNVTLKALEGVIHLMVDKGKKVFYSQAKDKGMDPETMKVLKQEMGMFDLHQKGRGGAPLLGLRKPVYKAHGSSDAVAFANAIDEALDYAESGASEYIKDHFQEIEEE